jgi:hypothetical protein
LTFLNFTLSWETEKKNQGSLKLKLMEAFRNFLLLKKCSNLKVLLHKNDIVPSQPNSKQTHQIRRLKI